MKKKLTAVALLAASALAVTACAGAPAPSGSATAPTETTAAPTTAAPAAQDITFWLIGGDTNQDLREYLIKTYNEKTGGNLIIEEQSWGDVLAKLTTALPDANNTPDVTEIGNTQAPTFTNVGAFSDISDMYEELGGSKLLPGFVDVGSVDGKLYAAPYYFGSRYVFYRKDVWAAAGVEVPKTLAEFNAAVKTITEKNPKDIKDFSGFFLGGQDWRNSISWIFANGGDLAKKENGQWVSTLSDPNTIKGLEQIQDLQENASNAPATMTDSAVYTYLNDSGLVGEQEVTLSAATVMAPGWAHWSIGDVSKNDEGKLVNTWNDDVFGTFVLPGVDGGAAPVFAGGSNIGISAASPNQEGARELLRIIFSPEYQQLLGGAGLGPANLDYVSSLGDDQFADALRTSAANAKLTPAAPGWAVVESQLILEEFFQKIAEGGDIASLAAEYDAKITPLLNAGA